MNYFTVDNLRDGYVRIVSAVAQLGETQAPRGMRTQALSNAHIQLTRPWDALPIGVGRGLHLPIAAVEAIQIIGAFQDPALMLRVSPRFAQFMDDGRFWGGYGERIGHQMLDVGRKLQQDPDTRQAVVTLWRPHSDNVPGKHDYPCTLSLVFQMFKGRLELSVTMRSNDVWLGLAYDAFVFTQLQMTLARWLGVAPGAYHHHAVNLHLYERDLDSVKKLHMPNGRDLNPLFTPRGFGRRPHDDLFGVLMRARTIGRGEPITRPTPDEQWFIDQLAPYVQAET